MIRYTYKDYTIEVYKDSVYKDNSEGEKFIYSKQYFGEEGKKISPTSQCGIKVCQNNKEVTNCTVIASERCEREYLKIRP